MKKGTMIERAKKIRDLLKQLKPNACLSKSFIARRIGSDPRSVGNLIEIAEVLRHVKKVGYDKETRTVYRWEEKE